MTELQEIDVVILSTGEVKLEVRGVKGPKCEDVTRPLEAVLGGEVLDRRRHDEYYQEPQEGSLEAPLEQS